MIIVALNSQHLLTGMSKFQSQLSGSDAVVVTLANWLLHFLTDPRAATSQDGRRFELPAALHTCNEWRRLQSSLGLNVMNGHRRIPLGFNLFESPLQESSKLCGSFISLVHPYKNVEASWMLVICSLASRIGVLIPGLSLLHP